MTGHNDSNEINRIINMGLESFNDRAPREVFRDVVAEAYKAARREILSRLTDSFEETPKKHGKVGRPKMTDKEKKDAAAMHAAGAKRPRRTAEQIAAIEKNVLAWIKANPGKGAIEIKAAVKEPDKFIQDALNRLRKDDKVKTAGKRRGMTYA